jgi:hypothetical protein
MVCGKCILNDSTPLNYDSMGIKEIVIRELQQSVRSKFSDEKVALLILEYPCPVANRFECPYKNSGRLNDDNLITTGEIIDIVCKAIKYADQLTYNNDKITIK